MSTREVASSSKLISPTAVPTASSTTDILIQTIQGYWTRVSSTRTPTKVLLGAENYAMKYDFPVLYGMITKTGRGKYRLEYKH